jgi:hypothetical protein
MQWLPQPGRPEKSHAGLALAMQLVEPGEAVR